MQTAEVNIADHQVLLRLKAATGRAHEQIERAPLLAALFLPEFSLDDYARLLRAMGSFVAAVEAQQSVFAAALPQFELRRKQRKLEQDCATLSVAINELSPDRAPRLNTVARALGAAYVMEGASMGGRVILNQLRRHFPDSVFLPTAFYAGYGKQTGALWRLFRLAVVEHVSAFPEDEPEIIDAALETFSTLDQWLRDPIHSSRTSEKC